MMMTKLDQNQAKTLAAFIATIRTDWQPAGIYTALGKARDLGAPDQIAHAAIRAAMTPTNRTPAVIAMQGEHWTAPKPASTVPHVGPGRTRCTEYGHEYYPAPPNCPGCAVADRITTENTQEKPNG